MKMTKAFGDRLNSFAEERREKNNSTNTSVTLTQYQFMAVQHLASDLRIKKSDVVSFAVDELIAAAVKAGTWPDKKTWMELPDEGDKNPPEKKIGMSELGDYDEDDEDEGGQFGMGA
tara:strand:- start:1612 stop:1962 length:351 start_codon:yes stop_codon:yes gene_type:complete